MKARIQLKSNQQVTLYVDGPSAVAYTVRIDKVEPRRLWVSAPVLLPRHARAKLSLSLNHENPARSCRYEAHVSVTGQDRSDPARVALSHPREWVKVQERDYARMRVAVPVKWRLTGELGAKDPTWRLGETVDISGGGIRMGIPGRILPEGEHVDLSFNLSGAPVEATAEVIRGMGGDDSQYHEERHERIVALNFVRIREVDRDRIVRFVFRLQADMRRKGLA